ncbi:MAG: peptidylprolyl isomerase [Pseudomonadota bacterium]
MDTNHTTIRPTRLVTAMGGGLLLAAGLLTGCSGETDTRSADKTPLGETQNGSEAERFTSIPDGEVVARINGSPLYKQNLEVVKDNLGEAVPQNRLVSRMVELRLLANQAREDGLDSDPKTRARIQNAIDNQLANAYLTRYVANLEIDENDLRSAYADVEAEYAENTQYRARHILVDSEDKARDILAQLEDGASFEELAKANSSDSGSADKGGDLGWFNLDQMVAPFAEAVGALEPGQTESDPVESRFGWHVIRLDDSRPTPAPSFDDMRPELEDHIRRQAVNDMIAELRADANVEILASDVSSIVERDDAPADTSDETSSGHDGLPAEPLKALP